MPSQESQYRPHDMVYWEKTGQNRYDEPTFASPVTIKVRWNVDPAEVMNPQGSNIGYAGEIVLNQAVVVGSKVWFGTYEEFLGTGSAGLDDQVMYVKSYSDFPDLKGRFSYKTATLSRFKDEGSDA